MSASQIVELLRESLDASLGLVFILAGAYSLYFNVNDAKRKNHRKAERVARLGGWLYIIAGAVVIIAQVR